MDSRACLKGMRALTESEAGGRGLVLAEVSFVWGRES